MSTSKRGKVPATPYMAEMVARNWQWLNITKGHFTISLSRHSCFMKTITGSLKLKPFLRWIHIALCFLPEEIFVSQESGQPNVSQLASSSFCCFLHVKTLGRLSTLGITGGFQFIVLDKNCLKHLCGNFSFGVWRADGVTLRFCSYLPSIKNSNLHSSLCLLSMTMAYATQDVLDQNCVTLWTRL